MIIIDYVGTRVSHRLRAELQLGLRNEEVECSGPGKPPPKKKIVFLLSLFSSTAEQLSLRFSYMTENMSPTKHFDFVSSQLKRMVKWKWFFGLNFKGLKGLLGQESFVNHWSREAGSYGSNMSGRSWAIVNCADGSGWGIRGKKVIPKVRIQDQQLNGY